MDQGNRSYETLEEPILHTLLREINHIGRKVKVVLLPKQENLPVLKDWDLWGPLLFCLYLALLLSFTAPQVQSEIVFSGIFTIVWVGSSLVTINAQLLRAKLSFFQSVCLIGYCIVPLLVASTLFCFIHYWLLRFPIAVVAWAWSSFAATFFLGKSAPEDKRLLVVIPVTLLYSLLGWMVLAQGSVLPIDKQIFSLIFS